MTVEGSMLTGFLGLFRTVHLVSLTPCKGALT